VPHELTTCHTVSRAWLQPMALHAPHGSDAAMNNATDSLKPAVDPFAVLQAAQLCVLLLQQMEEDWVKKFFQFTGFNLLLAFLCCMSLFLISPAASGSGIPDVKAYLNGVEHPIFKNFFTVKTFVAKVHSSYTAHIGCTTANTCIH
jgi:hypothetical protein